MFPKITRVPQRVGGGWWEPQYVYYPVKGNGINILASAFTQRNGERGSDGYMYTKVGTWSDVSLF